MTNYSTAVFIIDDAVTAVKAIYEPPEQGGAPRIFKTYDKAIKKDDLIIVPTNTRFKFAICKVVEANVAVDLDSPVELTWVAGTYDPSEYEEILNWEADKILKMQTIEKNKRRRELRANLTADAEEAKVLLAPMKAVDAG